MQTLTEWNEQNLINNNQWSKDYLNFMTSLSGEQFSKLPSDEVLDGRPNRLYYIWKSKNWLLWQRNRADTLYHRHLGWKFSWSATKKRMQKSSPSTKVSPNGSRKVGSHIKSKDEIKRIVKNSRNRW